jgi:ABC-type dipeptide/oligopeptide/nickel transport system permease component
MRIVVALGGNALLRRGEPMTADNQRAIIRIATEQIAKIHPGNQLVIAHGNGPQVGLLSLQAAAYTSVTPYPLDVLGADYIRTARAMGLREITINTKYALKNAGLPVITIIGLKLGELIAFSIVTETVFQWPGMGLLFIQAVSFADVPIMAAYLFMVAFVFVTINVLVDLLYVALDPRLRSREEAA